MKKRLLILFPYQGGIDLHLAEATWPADLDAEVGTLAYRDDGDDQAERLIQETVENFKPDVVCFSTACGLPMLDALAEVRKRCRLVHWCMDAACPDMRPTLQAYKDAATFDLSINTDGNRDWPQRDGDLTMQYPIHPGAYAERKPTARRLVQLGFSGTYGDGGETTTRRGEILRGLGDRVVVDRREGHVWPYLKHARFMLDCQAALNTAWCGTERALHCKTRVVEAGLAGCLLFETKGSPTRDWFRPGLDYLEYETPAEVVEVLDRPDFLALAAVKGARLRDKVLKLNPHGTFWKAVMG